MARRFLSRRTGVPNELARPQAGGINLSSVLMDLIRTIFANRRVSPGWAMPMGWFAWFGVMMAVMFGRNGWLQNIVLTWAGWSTLWIMGLVGTAAIGYHLATSRFLTLRKVFGLRYPVS